MEIKEDKVLLREEIEKLEKNRLLQALVKETPKLVHTYKTVNKHTGGLLTASMAFAYERGLLDAIKTLTKENKGE